MARKRVRVGLGTLVPCVVVVSLIGGAPAHAVTAGAPVTDAAYAFTAKIESETAACSGVLVSRQWVLTASSCFAVDGKTEAGPPKHPTTVTVGRLDLATTAGHVVSVTELVPRADRNVVLARISEPIMDIAPVKLATAPPQADEVLQVAGFGRTATEWVPDLLHSAPFEVMAVTATTLDIAGQTPGESSTCKGDSGGPALRQAGGQLELVALHGSSWQHGCYGSEETRTGSTEIRVDDLGAWIAEKTRDVAGDFNRDGKSDIAGINGPRDMLLFTGDNAGKLKYGGVMYGPGGDHQWNYKAMTAGDFNNDGTADLAAINSQGDLLLFTGDGAGKLKYAGVMYGPGGDRQWIGYRDIAAGDFNNDGKSDIAGINGQGDLLLFTGDGAGKLKYAGVMYGAGGDRQWIGYRDITAGDFNGDGKSDIAGINGQGDLLAFTGDGAGKLKYLGVMYGAGGDRQWIGYLKITSGDYNGDGKSDIAGINGQGDLLAFTGDGAGKLKYLGVMYGAGGDHQWKDYLAIA